MLDFKNQAMVNNTKKCIYCENIYPLTEEFFHKRPDTPSGFRNNCRKCNKSKVGKYHDFKKENEKLFLEGKRRCTYCNEIKNLEGGFYKNSGRSKGYSERCGECQIKLNKIKKCKEYLHFSENRKFTINDYEKLIIKQNNKCLICERDFSQIKDSPNLDHCHKTNKVRGILCYKCNVGIGLFKDNIEVLKRAISYLKLEYVDTIAN